MKYALIGCGRIATNHVKAVLNSGVSSYSLYKYGLYINQIVANMLSLDKSEIVGVYEKLPIKSRKEIDITSEEIQILLNTKPGPIFKEIYDNLEKEILSFRLENTNEKIKEYILNNYR